MGRPSWQALFFVAAASWLAVRGVWPVQDEITNSFGGYWVVARELAAGTPVVRLYEDGFLNARMAAQGVPLREHFLGPPTLAITLLPLAELPYEAARRVWLWGLCFPALMGSAWVLRREAGKHGALLAALVLFLPAVQACFDVGQVYTLFLALHVGALASLARGPSEPAGAAAGLMMALRGWYGLPLMVGWAWRGQWRAAGGAVLAAASIILLTLPLTGVAAWTHFVTVQLPSAAADPWAGTPAYQTLRSFVLQLTTPSPHWGPSPLLPAPGLAPWAFLGLALAGVASVARVLRRAEPAVAMALLVVVEIALAPAAQEYHYVVAALPMLVAAGRVRDRLDLGLVAAGWLLLLLPWNLQDPERLGGWRSLTAYPRLGGLLLLAAMLVRAARSGTAPPHDLGGRSEVRLP